MKIKTTMRYHLRPVRMAIVNRSTNKKCWRGCGERRALLHCWWECRLVQPLWKAVYGDTSKIKNGSAFWPSDPTSGNITEETQNTNLKEHKHPYVHCSIIYNCQHMEAAQVSISRWVDKTTMGYLHNGILLKHKKGNLIFCDSMDRYGEYYLSKVGQSEKDNYHMLSLICGI